MALEAERGTTRWSGAEGLESRVGDDDIDPALPLDVHRTLKCSHADTAASLPACLEAAGSSLQSHPVHLR